MSFLLSQLSKFLGKQEMRCLMLGLDGSGKTSILYRLKHGKITESEIIPTVGFNCECIEYKRLIFSVWDVSGSADTRCFWRFYYKDTHALIFVVDSSDEVRMEEAREELHRLLTEFELWACPLLVMANKTDLPNALPLRRITEILQLFSLSNRNWYIVDTKALHPDPVETNLHAGLDWLAETTSMPATLRQELAKKEHMERQQERRTLEQGGGKGKRAQAGKGRRAQGPSKGPSPFALPF